LWKGEPPGSSLVLDCAFEKENRPLTPKKGPRGQKIVLQKPLGGFTVM